MELYKIVLPDFPDTIDQLISGITIAMEIRQKDVVASFKKLCGAYNPKTGRDKLHESTTLRSMYGIDKHKNAVHCTDIPDEGILECEYFFVLLPEKKMNKD
jgi:nucleoside-diphosphate kinase